MRIQILESMVGDSHVLRPGDLVDVDEAAGRRLIENGRAIAVSAASAPSPETPEKPRSRRTEGR